MSQIYLTYYKNLPYLPIAKHSSIAFSITISDTTNVFRWDFLTVHWGEKEKLLTGNPPWLCLSSIKKKIAWLYNGWSPKGRNQTGFCMFYLGQLLDNPPRHSQIKPHFTVFFRNKWEVQAKFDNTGTNMTSLDRQSVSKTHKQLLLMNLR